jgi:MFS family permease
MKRYNLINTIAGWVIFSIAAVVYLSTIEPPESFWDCGEFISSSYKLEVGHPPGAPFFMIVARFFTLFAGNNPENVAKMVNSMSALASAATILFLFWTITHLARKIVFRNKDYSTGSIIAVIGAGAVGALAYTFSDSFWFSAVEGEVYASSSLFTALVFWAILKWENVADEPHANRWLVFIAYLMGLSIGVHLLNLLAIPAIVLVYYFRKYEVTRAGVIKALLVSALLLGSIIYIIIPGLVKVASFFELIFVNSFGLPYFSGTLFYFLLLIGLIVWGVYYTHTHGKMILNTAILFIAVIIIGYSSYAMLVIRSSANLPMDQNDPEDMFSLLYYLNREQYGDRPLIHGQYFNAPVLSTKEGKAYRIPKDGKYVKTSNRMKYVYDDRYTTLFPRMWSSEDEHVRSYIEWAKLNERNLFEAMVDQQGNVVRDRQGNVMYDHNKSKKAPTFGQNLRFFFRYQLGHMYFRYFMWNFSGRQNDIQGHSQHEITKGNWITGIPFLDEIRLGNQDKLPNSMLANKARNRYFMLPLLLGIAGLIYHYSRNRKDFWVVMVLFIMTGIAIVVYLNQYPNQPRERDYAFAGSFYAFAIWIGLGVLALYAGIQKILPDSPSALLSSVLALAAVPLIMGIENWDDHDRSGRYMARDFAYNYLNSCAPNAVLFTNGDNEGIRTDVRVVNLSYLGADWYIEQMQRRAYESAPLPISMTKDKYVSGNRDITYIIDRFKDYVNLKDLMDFVVSDDPRTKSLPNVQEKIDYIPARKFIVPVDSAKVISNGTVPPEMAGKIVKEMRWELDPSKRYLVKNHLMILDMLSSFNWDRPIYYAITVSDDNYLNLEKFFQIHGLAFRIVPIESAENMYGRGGINTKIMFDNFVHTFKWGNINNPDVYVDENVSGMMTNFRNNFGRLALELIKENKKDSAKIVLEKCQQILPDTVLPHNIFSLALVDCYMQLGDTIQASTIRNKLMNNVFDDLDYYVSLGKNYENYLVYEKQVAFYVLDELRRQAYMENKKEFLARLEEKIQYYSNALNIQMR